MSLRDMRKAGITLVLALLFVAATTATAMANLDQVKLYKKVFEGEKPKCTTCHVDKTPKKDDGKHEWNEYGQKLRKVKETPDEDTYKTVGKNDKAED